MFLPFVTVCVCGVLDNTERQDQYSAVLHLRGAPVECSTAAGSYQPLPQTGALTYLAHYEKL